MRGQRFSFSRTKPGLVRVLVGWWKQGLGAVLWEAWHSLRYLPKEGPPLQEQVLALLSVVFSAGSENTVH